MIPSYLMYLIHILGKSHSHVGVSWTASTWQETQNREL